MADAFRVNPQALSDALQLMREFVMHTESVVAEIDALANQLHGTWSGRAAAAHAEAHRHWSRGEAKMRQALTQLNAAGITAHHNYMHATATNTAMWS